MRKSADSVTVQWPF